MSLSALVGLTALALAVGVGACSDGDDQAATPAGLDRAARARVIRAAHAPCDVGERPGYFVPGPVDSPLALLGCARLGVSGKRVELSANLARIDGASHVCINPAYNGRGQPGIYIPAICMLDPGRFAVRDASRPQQAVRRYAYVIWGSSRAQTSGVTARFADGVARAAVFKVGPKLSRRFAEHSFSLFVVELPVRAACAQVIVEIDGSDAKRRVGPRPKVCERG